ncbi:MAG: BACON domain-containing protein [Bacteroidales bacterium]|nr:BACON domain-containing protein [Bacteroidales bacterium]
MKKTLLLLAALVAMAACTKVVEKEVEVEVEVEKIVDLLTLNATSIQVSNAGVVQPMSFTTEDAWTIASDAAWITFDKASGNAGSSTVNMTVAKNEGYDSRTGRVTLSTTHNGTTKNTVFTVVQSETEVFNTTQVLNIGFKEQDIAVEFTSNLAPEVKVLDGDWLTITQTKAAPEDGKIVVHAAKNDGENARVGSFTIFAGNSLQTYKVVQASQFASASTATAEFLGFKQDMYNSTTYWTDNFAQFGIKFETPEGLVNLALNVDPEIEDVTKVPAGKYVMDETGTYEPGTFSVKSAGLNEQYYTTVTVDGEDMDVISGTVTVEETAGQYTIVATLVDANGDSRMYRFQGELVATDSSFGMRVYQASDRGQYYTYFTTKAYETILGVQFSDVAPGLERYISYMGFSIYSEASDGKLPTGTFTYAEPENDATLGYANGILNAAPGTFQMTGCENRFESWGDATYAVKEGTNTLEIVKQDNGLYTLKFNMTIVRTPAEGAAEDIPFNVTVNDVYCDGLADMGMRPHPDGDFDFSAISNSYYMPRWYGDKYETGCQLFHFFGFQNINSDYDVYLALNVKDDEWVFEQNFNNRFCSTPFKVGTFTFSWTPGENTLLPIKNYHRILNKYTGHAYIVTGGSITLTSETISYDLTATYEGKSYHFGGSHEAKLYYIQDKHTAAAPTLDPAPAE